MGVKIDSISDSCSTTLFYRCFQLRCQCHCDVTSKACGWLTFFLFRSSRRQHQVQAASLRDGGFLLFVCMSVRVGGCLSCRSLLVIVFVVDYGRSFYDTIMTSVFGVIVHRQCRPRFDRCPQCTLDCLVHSQQQECTPDRHDCTVDSEASEA